MTELDGRSQPVVLGGSYKIRAPGIVGEATLVRQRSISGVTRSTTGAKEGAALDKALASQGVQDVATVEVKVTRRIATPAGSSLRSANGDDALELEVPAPKEGEGIVVLAVDESGAITWNYPLADNNEIATSISRGPGAVVRFRVPRTPAVAPPPGGQRSLFGTIGKKILKVLVYPLTDGAVGFVVNKIAERWEDANRPYRFRQVTPDNYASPDVPALSKTDPAWKDLAAGRSLLFIHGTFSTTHSAFAGLTRDDVQVLSDAYGGRLFAFDHHTISHSPSRNVEEFLALFPADVVINADVICHSRGGLLSRELAERAARQTLNGRLNIGKIVFVGVPNAGTILTEPDHMTHMIDRMTTAIDALPDGPATWTLESLITAVKVIGHGGLKALDGLASMNPKGKYLGDLNVGEPGSAVYYGIAANFQPKGTSFDRLALKQFAGNAVMDRIFMQEENDLVVPTKGVAVWTGQHAALGEKNVLTLDGSAGVTHTTYFSHPKVREHLRMWLTG
ncbi:MAG: hypothetical protein H7Z40_01295 [Phycisphaerae bacterium]|nr:hypothetical protein [Gemmatimonadaceae bacterium]